MKVVIGNVVPAPLYTDSDMWYEIGDNKAGLKTSQAPRNSLEERANMHCKSAKRLSEVGHIQVTKTHRKNGVEGNIKQVTQQEIRNNISFKFRDFCRRDEDSRMIGRTFSDNQHTFSVISRDIFRCEREELDEQYRHKNYAVLINL